jgi:hypothetical protein
LGTRQIGIAVIRHDSLASWHIRRFRGPWSAKRLEAITSFLWFTAQKYQVTDLSVKVPPRGHLSNGLQELVYEIGTGAAKHNLELSVFRIQELNRFLAKRSLNKTVMMKLVAERFTILQPLYEKEIHSRRKHHVKTFEAVLAAVCANDK